MIPAGVPHQIAKLMAEGRVTWSGKKFIPPRKVPRLGTGPSLSDYIAEDRR
jgi:hypothetical protein